jgi:hypothetical protein
MATSRKYTVTNDHNVCKPVFSPLAAYKFSVFTNIILREYVDLQNRKDGRN